MKACFQLLKDRDGNKRRCCEPFGTEHYHDLDDIKSFDVDEFHDYVLSHGFGAPTRYAYRKAADLMASGELGLCEAATEIAARGLTTQP